MPKLIIVANRLPISVQRRRTKIRIEPSVGGLATAVGSFHNSRPSIWIGWPGIEMNNLEEEERQEIEAVLLSNNCFPVALNEKDIEDFYQGFCNNTIWPLFHYFPEYATYNKEHWQAYERVNQAYCQAVLEVAEEGDLIWIHDYQLMLLPRMLRDHLKKATIGFFLHIPFPSFEIFRLMPWRNNILEGLLGADLVGFHTYDYVWYFLDSVHGLLGHESAMGQITTPERLVKADVFPIGIDYRRYSRAAKSSVVQAEISKFSERLGGSKIALSIDRLDYTKGIPNRLVGFESFLEAYPEHREKITLVLVVVPSRTAVDRYAQLKKHVDELVGSINGKYGTIGWTPIWYLYRSLPFESLIALYTMADIALVTPLRDGMNLIAKEYIATRTKGKGVLILSETAGAARELGESLIINVNNPDEIAEAIAKGLRMPKKHQIEANRIMQKRLKHHDVERWANEFLDRLIYTRSLQDEIEARGLIGNSKDQFIEEFQIAQTRLLLLDYDGTLVPFSSKPEKAQPGSELIGLLKTLSKDLRNEVVVISGRDSVTLEKWFGKLPIGLISGHGAKVRERGKLWEIIQEMPTEWKNEVRPIFELYVGRTPGSFIEEKEFSLVWHYRNTVARLGDQRARELTSDLLNLTANLDLQVLEGSKVVEVKNTGINKGRAAQRWISQKKWGFILGIGDDLTDEDMFKVLPETAWSIKVRFAASAARFNVGSPTEVRTLLKELAQISKS